MQKVVVALLALLGALVLVAVLVVAALGLISVLGQTGVPSRVILELDLEGEIVEMVPDDPLAQLMHERALSVGDIVEGLDRAAEDRRVKALIARIGGGGLGLAHVQEIRDAVARFRAAGKPAVAWAETFGEFGPGNTGYYLATAFDEIWLQPSGDVGLTGLMLEAPFARGLLDKLDVDPQIDQRYEYKNAADLYSQTRFTAAHREAMQSILGSWFGQIVRGIAEARGLEEAQVRERFDGGPYYGQEALEGRLVDKLAYRDEVYDAVRERAGEGAEPLFLSKYLERAGRRHRRGETIALIHGFGAVVRGKGGYSPLDGTALMGSDAVASAFRAAVRDKRVKAIIFRVDSPGGSYVASDTIWRETVRARDAGKPVIVSMGNLAGSGGYFVAMHADRIVAEPGTITGSIGVFGGKLVTRGLWRKLGITWDDVQTSANSAMWSTSYDYDVAEQARLDAGLDRIYEDFTRKVAEGRELPLERVREIARGRIWTGAQAKELGLVDELGGLDVALRLARESAGLAADAAVRLKRFPPPRSAWELLFREQPDNSERTATAAALAEALRAAWPARAALRQLGLLPPRGALSMPEAAELP